MENGTKLLSHLIKIATNAGDTVLDPFMGVGSSGVAALSNDRKFIGIELEKDYYTAAVARLKDTAQQTILFQKTEENTESTCVSAPETAHNEAV